ncbi:calbindin-like [Bolinopsis microptera]|uniref:calbindin-like n=1 Tax=Bolinopsis microptera TaxID=2820187 RepID=UPI00307A470C
MPFEYRKRQCANTLDLDHGHGQYRIHTQPTCNEEIFSVFKDKSRLSASDFKNIWQHYDRDMNGYIEAEELEAFLRDLFVAQGQYMCKQELETLRVSIIECYDENRDGRIEVLEMTKFLPVENNFLLHFRIKGSGKMTCAEFIEIWKHYDKDKSGYLEEKEIGHFLLDLLRVNRNITISEEEMKKMVEEVMKNFDENNDGMIEFNEMKNLLNVEDNVLTELSLTKNLSTQQFNTIFDYYDNDRSNFLEGEEIKRFVLDLMQRAGHQLSDDNIDYCITAALKVADKDSDGRISREELASFLYTDNTDYKRSPKFKKKSPRPKKKKKSPASPGTSQCLKDLVEEYGNKHLDPNQDSEEG